MKAVAYKLNPEGPYWINITDGVSHQCQYDIAGPFKDKALAVKHAKRITAAIQAAVKDEQ